MKTNSKHIDLAYLKQLSNGSNEFISQMILIFSEQTPQIINDMEKSLGAKDWKSLRAAAHKMKPSISIMGIKELEEVIPVIEKYSENQENLDELPELLDKVKDVCSVVIEELETEKKAFM